MDGITASKITDIVIKELVDKDFATRIVRNASSQEFPLENVQEQINHLLGESSGYTYFKCGFATQETCSSVVAREIFIKISS